MAKDVKIDIWSFVSTLWISQAITSISCFYMLVMHGDKKTLPKRGGAKSCHCTVRNTKNWYWTSSVMTVIFLSLFILSLTTMCLSLATMGWMSTHGRKNGCRWPTSSGLTSNNKTWNSRVHRGYYKIIEEIYMFGNFTPIYEALVGPFVQRLIFSLIFWCRQLEQF